MRYVLHFPREVDVVITPKKVPTDEFREKIRKSFHDFTEGTAEAYRVQDKLYYLQLIREENFKVDARELLNGYIRESLENSDSECIELDEFKNLSVIEDLINEGIHRFNKSWHHWSGDHRLDEVACQFVAAAIEEVMKY